MLKTMVKSGFGGLTYFQSYKEKQFTSFFKTLKLREYFMLRQKSLKLYRDLLKTIKNIPLESDRQQFKIWVKEDFKKNKFESDEYSIKTLHKYGQKSLDDLKLNLALSSKKIS